jgi:hypothetical protein
MAERRGGRRDGRPVVRRPVVPPARVVILTGVAVLVLLLAGCAAGANPAAGHGDAGFWLGLWQGLILPITFVVSLFTDQVTIYEVANNGNWYDAGFVLGAVCSLSGGGAASRSRG